MDIAESLKTINNFNDLDTFLESGKVKITFWGKRVVSVDGYKRSIEIDRIVDKFISIMKNNTEFDESERPLLKKVTASIDSLYQQSDILMSKANFLTRLFESIVFLFSRNSCSKQRWNWDISDNENYYYCVDNNIGYHHICNLYTASQYKKVFGKEPSVCPDYFVPEFPPYYQDRKAKPLKGLDLSGTVKNFDGESFYYQ